MSKFIETVKKVIDGKTIKFLIVGVINTICGAGTMYVLRNVFDVSYWPSTLANIIVGCIVSYFLNKYWTFEVKEKSLKTVLKFILVVAICYVFSYLIAQKFIEFLLRNQSLLVRDNVAMFMGMCIYTLTNYLGQRFFAFKKKSEIEA